jgi:hypothetical protein
LAGEQHCHACALKVLQHPQSHCDSGSSEEGESQNTHTQLSLQAVCGA